jgi:anti-sigma factor (TIGR02949 family)
VKCAETRRDLFAFLDGEVSVERTLEVLQHVNACPGCARRFEAEKRFEEGFDRVLSAEPPPAGMRARLDAALDRADRPLPRIRRFRFLALAAAVLVAAVLVSDRLCLGPFECPVIRAATEASAGAESGRGKGESFGFDWEASAVECPDGQVCRVAIPLGDHDPKPGHRVEDPAGRVWYEATVGDRRIVGWKDGPVFQALVTRDGKVDLDALATAARGK